MRLLLTTLFAGLAVFMALLMTRIWGLGQNESPFQHEYFASTSPFIVAKQDQLKAMEEAVRLRSDIILWVDARMSADGQVYLLDRTEDQKFLNSQMKKQRMQPDQKILKGGKLSDYSLAELQDFYKNLPLLKDAYGQFPKQRFIVNVIDNVFDVNDAVIKALKDENPNSRTFIQSDTLVVMTSIKDSKPEWVYGTSQADLMRFLSFNSMWILPSTQYKGDVFISPFQIVGRPAFNDEVIGEMRRRNKRIFLGPISQRAQFDEAKRLNADGYISENPSQLLQWLDQSQTH